MINGDRPTLGPNAGRKARKIGCWGGGGVWGLPAAPEGRKLDRQQTASGKCRTDSRPGFLGGVIVVVDGSGTEFMRQARAVLRSKLRIFISYRRGDQATEAYLLHARLLEAGFSKDNVFIDLEQKAGVSFVEQIEQAVGACDVLIAVVGPNWLDTPDVEGRRLDDPQNWTRREIEGAIDRDVTVIPVCVAGATMLGPRHGSDWPRSPERGSAGLGQAGRIRPGGRSARLGRAGDCHRQHLQGAAGEPVVRRPGGAAG